MNIKYRLLPYRKPSPIAAYSLAMVSVLVAALIRQALQPVLGERLPFSLFFVAVMVTAWYAGFAPALAALLVGAIAAFHFFVPANDLQSLRPADIVAMTLYFFEGVAIILISEAHHANRRRLEREVKSRTEAQARTALLYELTASLSASRIPQEVGSVIVEQAVAALHASRAAIALVTEGGQELTVISQAGVAQEISENFLRTPIDERIPLTDAVRTGKGVWIASEADLSRQYPELIGALRASGTRSIVCLPLVAHERTIGGLSLSFLDDRQLDSDERGLIQSLADQCSLAMERALLYKTETEARKAAETADQIKLQFFAMISRDFHAPLGTIKGLLTQAEQAKAADAVSPLKLAEAETDQLLDQIKQLLDLFQLEQATLSLNLEAQSLTDLVQNAQSQLQSICKQHHLSINIPGDLPRIELDSSRMTQVLVNLVKNACQYAPPDTVVTVSAAVNNQWLRVDVTDQGPGIPKEEREQVFKAFNRTQFPSSGQSRGSGIGLAVSRGLIEAHGGRIWVSDNDQQKGTKISLVLPIRIEPS